MTALRTAQLALVLSAITLALVVFVATRPAPVVPTNDAVLIAIANARAEIEELRRLVARGSGTVPGGVPADVTDRLDRLETSLSGVGAKLDAICGAIESSAFAPAGFDCP